MSDAGKPEARVGAGVVLAALGVVFGDIGTSPLYTLNTCFTTAHVEATPENVLGLVSLLFWTLTFVVCVKYVGVLLRIDHDGEGGILALLALVAPPRPGEASKKPMWLVWVVVLGAAMLFGDGIITPSISVLSAVEGIKLVTKAADPFVVPIAVAILVGLFAVQSRGTDKVGKLFGPVMGVWFVAIAVAGVIAIVGKPGVLVALDPRHAAHFVASHGVFGFLVFGAIVLCVTGVEALYADLSHFGRAPIAIGWYAIVFPALIASYFGQGALLLRDSHALANPFFALASGWALVPMVVLATLATIIASQALVSGAFTLAEQAVALDLWPRLKIVHTSRERAGQVFAPAVNAALGIGCVALVLGFRSSARLASAYGLAVAGTMLATSIVFVVVATRVLKWQPAVAIPSFAAFAIVDVTFVGASLPKFLDGAWIPLAVAIALLALSLTWRDGRRRTLRTLTQSQMPVAELLKIQSDETSPPEGTMVFFTGDPRGVPFVGKHRWLRDRAERERVVLLTLEPAGRPRVPDGERVTIEALGPRLFRIVARFGFMERVSIGPVFRACEARSFDLDDDETSFFYADPRIVRADAASVSPVQRGVFAFLLRNARTLPEDVKIPASRRIRLGIDVPL